MNNNAPAFPSTFPRDYGLTMRDYFAAKMMPALDWNEGIDICAEQAYKIADAMLKARLENE